MEGVRGDRVSLLGAVVMHHGSLADTDFTCASHGSYVTRQLSAGN
jgi:hypothetical protein